MDIRKFSQLPQELFDAVVDEVVTYDQPVSIGAKLPDILLLSDGTIRQPGFRAYLGNNTFLIDQGTDVGEWIRRIGKDNLIENVTRLAIPAHRCSELRLDGYRSNVGLGDEDYEEHPHMYHWEDLTISLSLVPYGDDGSRAILWKSSAPLRMGKEALNPFRYLTPVYEYIGERKTFGFVELLRMARAVAYRANGYLEAGSHAQAVDESTDLSLFIPMGEEDSQDAETSLDSFLGREEDRLNRRRFRGFMDMFFPRGGSFWYFGVKDVDEPKWYYSHEDHDWDYLQAEASRLLANPGLDRF